MVTVKTSKLKSTTLLIINNSDILHLVSAILGQDGYHVLSAVNEEDGQSLARDKTPDVIVTLAGKDGENELPCQRIRQDRLLADTPVVVLTTSGDSKTYSRYFADGCVQVLPVPFKCQALYSAIKNACSSNQDQVQSSIRVLYRSGRTDYVSPSQLDKLLADKELLSFQRKDGIVSIGRDPVRCFTKADYQGPERRTHVS